jgi:hypothetical protein
MTTEAFLERAKKENDLYVKPWEEEVSNSKKITVEFDKLAMESLIRINSQFLFATPALVIIVSKDKFIDIVIYPMLIFSIGLTVAAFCLIEARVVSQKAVDYWSHLRDFHMNEVTKRITGGSMYADKQLSDKIENFPEEAKKIEKSGLFHIKVAEFFGFTSLLCILSGSALLAIKLYTNVAQVLPK